MPIIQTHTRAGTPIKRGEITIQPVSQAVSWINRTWGFVWNRPAIGGRQYVPGHQPVQQITQLDLAKFV